MTIWYSPYELQPLTALNRHKKNRRHGFLIKVQTRSIEAGYADCHPILEFGDSSVEEQLKKLRAGKPSALSERSIALAKIDGRAREERKSLFSKTKVRSHYTCSDVQQLTPKNLEDWQERGFDTIKLKVGGNISMETQSVSKLSAQNQIRWRFDANSGKGETFLAGLNEDVFIRTDFIEDPMPFHAGKWAKLTALYSVPCAFDQPQGADFKSVYRGIRIIKPARDSRLARKRDVITNSMDHPVGQSFAFWIAQKAVEKFKGQSHDHGLITSHLFKSNNFFNEIATNSPYFKSSAGYGIGFNDLLKRQKWISL